MPTKGEVCMWFVMTLVAWGLSCRERNAANEQWQREAVKAGVAEWVTGEDGNPKWQWKERP